MTKVIILSIQSQHAVNILKGFKTMELRKSVPKGFSGWAYIYVTLKRPVLINKNYISEFYEVLDTAVKEYKKSAYQDEVLNGKVVARFWFDEYETIKERFNGDEYIIEKLDELCLSDYEVKEYLGNKKGYAWHIKKLEIFDEPKELSDFIVGLNYLGDIIPPTYKKLKKAPQSWQYVYVKGEKR